MATPIEKARNLGPATGPQLREAGIFTSEDLREIGWEEALIRVCELFPERIHTMMAWALMGAEWDCDISELSEVQKERGRQAIRRLRFDK